MTQCKPTCKSIEKLSDELMRALRELDEVARRLGEANRVAQYRWSKGCVYVMAVPGIEAVRIGRTVDLAQRVRRFAYENQNLPVEIIIVGHCNALDPEAKRAEAEIFRLLDDIHLSRHNRQLYAELPLAAGYDWYLPDRRRIKDAFWSLWRGSPPLFVHVQREVTFERFTEQYPAYATPDQIIRALDDF